MKIKEDEELRSWAGRVKTAVSYAFPGIPENLMESFVVDYFTLGLIPSIKDIVRTQQP
jgi:hypothetical protein